MRVEVESGDWASRAVQETVRKHFATHPAVRLELLKEGHRPIAFTARTASLLAGSYNEFLDKSFQKGFSISVSSAVQEQRRENRQEQAHAAGYGFGI